MLDLNRYTSPRLNPSQTRGKERIRLILATALKLFRDKGIDQTTTNDIAEAAHIPIGSVYRYFQNKEEIILAIADLQIQDMVGIFEEIGDNPLLPQLDWEEILLLITDSWLQHARINDLFAFLYFLRCNQKLHLKAMARWEKIGLSYAAILHKRNPAITQTNMTVILQMTWGAVELGVISQNDQLVHRSVQVAASYLRQHYS